MMRDIFDVLVAAASLCAGWWACDIFHDHSGHRESSLPVHPIAEPPSNVVPIVEDDQ